MSPLQKTYLFGCITFLLLMFGRYLTIKRVREKVHKAIKEDKELIFGAVFVCMVIWPISLPLIVHGLWKRRKEND